MVKRKRPGKLVSEPNDLAVDISALKSPGSWEALVIGNRYAVSGQRWNYYDVDWYEGELTEVIEHRKRIQNEDESIQEIVSREAVVTMGLDSMGQPINVFLNRLADLRVAQ
jgi:hypothetical protein